VNDRQYEAGKSRTARWVALWTDRLWLGQWRIRPSYVRNWTTDEDGSGGDTIAHGWASWQYQTLTVEFNMHQLLRRPLDEQEQHVLHELLHAVVREMRDGADMIPHEERVVTHLTNVLWHAWKKRAPTRPASRRKK